MKFKITRRGVYDKDGKQIPIGSVIDAEVGKDGRWPGWLVSKAEAVGGSGTTPVTTNEQTGNEPGTGENGPEAITPPGEGTSGADRQTLFKDTAGKLKSFEFTADGRPDLRALNAALPEGSTPFTADERDQLWPGVKDQVAKPAA